MFCSLKKIKPVLKRFKKQLMPQPWPANTMAVAEVRA